MSNEVCHRCAGTGFEPDHAAVGREYRRRREKLGLSLRSAGERIGVSAAYLSDLERGNRAWNTSITERVAAVYGS